ncbi:translin-associated factor X-interacting protein 1 [Microcaecilia unicolor]|uniref:Translin-associated factor X-interacting protein 1 n=1 Tax=Microcaecilia unicolor TaxID=1415580 RepID=A0A6P7Y8V5_9AMPH|nr:translin-associated factor X-interacting protein 1 [Microcaecilia unicolor]
MAAYKDPASSPSTAPLHNESSSVLLPMILHSQSLDSDLKYPLNLKRGLPLRESFRGYLSTWPAYGASETILNRRKPCTASDPRCYGSNEHSAGMVYKPQYLVQLESYLRKELQSLDLAQENTQELRLQPYREVFEFFIEDFKTYKPLLSAVKNEYEITLAQQREKIRSMEPLHSMLISMSEKCNQKILSMRDEERKEIKAMKKEKLVLLKYIDKMKEEKISLETQVSKLQSELAEQYMMYRNECDARRLLISDFNEVKQQMEEEETKPAIVKKIASEDPVTLRLALKMAQKNLTETQIELNRIKADYGDVVPRRDFEMQKKKMAELVCKVDTLQKDFNQLKMEYDTLLELNQQVQQQEDKHGFELDVLHRESTPRPSWIKCADVVPGGLDYWITVSEGKNSDQLVDVLLAELAGSILKEEFFDGMGVGENVPVYMKHEGKVKNLKLNKKDLTNVLQEIWKEKIAADQQEKKSSLPDFFHNYLQKKYDDSAIEWAYSIHETCRLCRTDNFLHLFYKILTEQVDESIYLALRSLTDNLLRELTSKHSTNNGNVTNEQFSLALKVTFPLKTGQQIQELIYAAEAHPSSNEDKINYKALLTEEEVVKSDSFIAVIWKQYFQEKQEYLKELKNKLETVKDVQVEDLKTAFSTIDPAIDAATLENYISHAFQIPKEQFEQAGPLDRDILFQRLEAAAIKRI